MNSQEIADAARDPMSTTARIDKDFPLSHLSIHAHTGDLPC